MMFEEERHAKHLYRALCKEFAGVQTDIQVSVVGDGVHWQCAAACGDRTCSVSCFDTRGPEYLASFAHRGRTEAWGRTLLMAELIPAIVHWLAGDGVDDLYTQLPFVDREKRALSVLAAETVQSYPELGQSAAHEIRHLMCDLNELWFTAKDRSCRVGYHGTNPFPDAFFHWDGCEMFRFPVDDPARLGSVLKRWLCDRVIPSAMEADFPWLRLAPVARSYEEGRPVEGEFLASWDSVEQFYTELNFSFTKAVLALIAAIRWAGYDKTLRAGQSLSALSSHGRDDTACGTASRASPSASTNPGWSSTSTSVA